MIRFNRTISRHPEYNSFFCIGWIMWPLGLEDYNEIEVFVLIS